MMETFTICVMCERLNRIPISATGTSASQNCPGCKMELTYRNGITDLNLKGMFALIEKAPNPLMVAFVDSTLPETKSFLSNFGQSANEWLGQMVFANGYTDKHDGMADAFQAWSLPSIVYFKNGSEHARKSGNMSSADITRWIRELLSEG